MRRLLCVVWGLAAMAGPALADDDAQVGKKLFTEVATPACALCHTLQAAGATGTVGPPLDELKPDAARVANALRNGVGVMPSYKATLTEEQIAVLARYVARVSGAGP
jgi:sulfite dehydrogenase